MSPEKQRIAIAEACGWKGPNSVETQARTEGWWSKDRVAWFVKPDGAIASICDVPNYLSDLNAMHEAEKILQDHVTGGAMPDIERYAYELQEVVRPQRQIIKYIGWMTIHATAAQRAEAFLRAVGKWEDEPTTCSCKCGAPAEKEHTCPYKEEINDDTETKCNCCKDCQRECADDI